MRASVRDTEYSKLAAAQRATDNVTCPAPAYHVYGTRPKPKDTPTTTTVSCNLGASSGLTADQQKLHNHNLDVLREMGGALGYVIGEFHKMCTAAQMTLFGRVLPTMLDHGKTHLSATSNVDMVDMAGPKVSSSPGSDPTFQPPKGDLARVAAMYCLNTCLQHAGSGDLTASAQGNVQVIDLLEKFPPLCANVQDVTAVVGLQKITEVYSQLPGAVEARGRSGNLTITPPRDCSPADLQRNYTVLYSNGQGHAGPTLQLVPGMSICDFMHGLATFSEFFSREDIVKVLDRFRDCHNATATADGSLVADLRAAVLANSQSVLCTALLAKCFVLPDDFSVTLSAEGDLICSTPLTGEHLRQDARPQLNMLQGKKNKPGVKSKGAAAAVDLGALVRDILEFVGVKASQLSLRDASATSALVPVVEQTFGVPVATNYVNALAVAFDVDNFCRYEQHFLVRHMSRKTLEALNASNVYLPSLLNSTDPADIALRDSSGVTALRRKWTDECAAISARLLEGPYSALESTVYHCFNLVLSVEGLIMTPLPQQQLPRDPVTESLCRHFQRQLPHLVNVQPTYEFKDRGLRLCNVSAQDFLRMVVPMSSAMGGAAWTPAVHQVYDCAFAQQVIDRQYISSPTRWDQKAAMLDRVWGDHTAYICSLYPTTAKPDVINSISSVVLVGDMVNFTINKTAPETATFANDPQLPQTIPELAVYLRDHPDAARSAIAKQFWALYGIDSNGQYGMRDGVHDSLREGLVNGTVELDALDALCKLVVGNIAWMADTGHQNIFTSLTKEVTTFLDQVLEMRKSGSFTFADGTGTGIPQQQPIRPINRRRLALHTYTIITVPYCASAAERNVSEMVDITLFDRAVAIPGGQQQGKWFAVGAGLHHVAAGWGLQVNDQFKVINDTKVTSLEQCAQLLSGKAELVIKVYRPGISAATAKKIVSAEAAADVCAVLCCAVFIFIYFLLDFAHLFLVL